nr:MAG TPA: hydrolase [Caudoviricetes sp.]
MTQPAGELRITVAGATAPARELLVIPTANLAVTSEEVPPGQGAATMTADPNNGGTLHIKVPRGLPGPANSLTIGEVTNIPPGSPATATITGTAPAQTLNLGLPQGVKGDKGDVGDLTPAAQATLNSAITQAQGSAQAAQTAQRAAETAQLAAETAKTEAQNAADSISIPALDAIFQRRVHPAIAAMREVWRDARTTPARVMCFGDSNVEGWDGARQLGMFSWVSRLAARTDSKPVTTYLSKNGRVPTWAATAGEQNNVGAKWINAGVGGTEARDFLHDRTAAVAAAFKPQINLVSIGTNDFMRQISIGIFKPALKTALQRILSTSVEARILLIGQWENGDAADRTIPWQAYLSAMAEAASELGERVAFADLHADLYGRIGVGGWDDWRLYGTDKTHFNAAGHKTFANLVGGYLAIPNPGQLIGQETYQELHSVQSLPSPTDQREVAILTVPARPYVREGVVSHFGTLERQSGSYIQMTTYTNPDVIGTEVASRATQGGLMSISASGRVTIPPHQQIHVVTLLKGDGGGTGMCYPGPAWGRTTAELHEA